MIAASAALGSIARRALIMKEPKEWPTNVIDSGAFGSRVFWLARRDAMSWERTETWMFIWLNQPETLCCD
jgi:hypothetical protein